MTELTIVMQWAGSHKKDLLELVGGSAGLSVVLEAFLHKFHVDSKKLAYFLIHAFTFLTTVAMYFLVHLKGYDTLPLYGTLVILAQTWHRFIVSPAYTKYIAPYVQFVASQKPVATTPVQAAPPDSGFVG